MPAIFPRDEEGEWTFHYAGVAPAGDVVVTIGFHCDDPSSYDQNSNDDVSDEWKVVVASTLCSQMTYTRLTTLINTSGTVKQFETIANQPGGLTGNTMLPLNSAVVVKKQTGLAGRRNRGRIYLPGIPEDAVDDSGNVLGSFLTTINSKLNTFQANCIANVSPDCEVAILHKEIHIDAKPAYDLADEEATIVTVWAADPVIGSQRGRQRD